MNATITKLLEPLNGDQPCGPDLSNDPKHDELANIAKGKPEVEIGTVVRPAEPPDWRELRDKSAVYLAESKDLGVAVMYSCSLLKTDGLAGFCDGLQLIQGLLGQYWPTVHPRLDPEDNNDPTQRLNILGSLTAPRASVGGWLRINDYLYAAEICRPKGRPPITFEQLQAAMDKAPGAPDAAGLSSALRAEGNQVIAARQQTLTDALGAAQGIDQFLTTTLGAGNTISFETLLKTLEQLITLLAPLTDAGAAAAGSTDAAAGAENSAPGGGVSISIRGSVKSRDDVVRVIDAICDYYQQVEPGSPVPYVLRRAQKMVKMNFFETMHELSLATADTLRPSMGSLVDSSQPPAA